MRICLRFISRSSVVIVCSPNLARCSSHSNYTISFPQRIDYITGTIDVSNMCVFSRDLIFFERKEELCSSW